VPKGPDFADGVLHQNLQKDETMKKKKIMEIGVGGKGGLVRKCLIRKCL
jgi:hypothetical protein